MNLEHISFTTPQWILNFYNFIAIFQIIVNISSIVLIIFKSLKIDNFRWYLLWFQICMAFNDFFVSAIFKPIFLFPLWALYSDGIFSTYFNFEVHWGMVICIGLLTQFHCVLLFCFLRRHSTISKLSFRPKKLKAFYLFTTILSETASISTIFLMSSLHIERFEALKIISETYPTLLSKFEALNNFAFYTPSFVVSILVIISVITFTGMMILALTLTTHMIRTLRENAHKISHSNLSKHQAALKGLIAQSLASMAVLIPFAILEAMIIFRFDHGQSMFHILNVILCFHSTLNLIVLVTTYHPYRQFMKSLKIQKKFRRILDRTTTLIIKY